MTCVVGLRRLTRETHCSRRFCGLGGWPLPTRADGDALHISRTKAASAVAMIRRHSKTGARSGGAGFRGRSESISGAGGPVRGNPSPPNEAGLFELGLGTGVEQLLDGGFGLG